MEPDHGLLPSDPELNDGKAQEYENRKEYDAAKSVLKHPLHQIAEETADKETGKAAVEVRYLFTTKTCPNCAIARRDGEKGTL